MGRVRWPNWIGIKARQGGGKPLPCCFLRVTCEKVNDSSRWHISTTVLFPGYLETPRLFASNSLDSGPELVTRLSVSGQVYEPHGAMDIQWDSTTSYESYLDDDENICLEVSTDGGSGRNLPVISTASDPEVLYREGFFALVRPGSSEVTSVRLRVHGLRLVNNAYHIGWCSKIELVFIG